MITDDDVKKLSKVFATKDDLKAMATKDDLKALEKTMAKQKDLLDVKQKLDDLSDYVIPAIGSIFRWTDDLHTAFVGKKRNKSIPEN